MVKPGDELQQAKGALASLLLMAILGGLALVAGRMAATAPVPARSARCSSPASSCPARPPAGGAAAAERSAGRAIAGGLARSAPPQMDALGNSLGLALAACALGAAVCLLAGLRPGARRWLGLATAGPAGLPLADGQYRLALYAGLTVTGGPSCGAICCGWCPDAVYFAPGRRQRDPRLTVVARTLGWGSTRIFWLLTLPSLTRPLLTAPAVGFSVSIAQYLPTLWLGLAEFRRSPAAVALSSGGEAQTLAAQALWQLLLPAVCFTLTALLAAGRPLSTRTSLVLTVNHLTLSVRRQPLLREVAFR